jgi:hypothetical protein
MVLFLSILRSLTLGVWLGSLIMLGAAVAAPVFQQSPSKTLSGQINSVILSRMNMLEAVCGWLALIAALSLLLLLWTAPGRGWRVLEVCSTVVMLAVLWSYSSKISSRMEVLRSEIKDFDHPQTTNEYVTAKAEFDSLHKTYTRLVGANMILLVASFAVSLYVLKKY